MYRRNSSSSPSRVAISSILSRRSKAMTINSTTVILPNGTLLQSTPRSPPPSVKNLRFHEQVTKYVYDSNSKVAFEETGDRDEVFLSRAAVHLTVAKILEQRRLRVLDQITDPRRRFHELSKFWQKQNEEEEEEKLAIVQPSWSLQPSSLPSPPSSPSSSSSSPSPRKNRWMDKMRRNVRKTWRKILPSKSGDYLVNEDSRNVWKSTKIEEIDENDEDAEAEKEEEEVVGASGEEEVLSCPRTATSSSRSASLPLLQQQPPWKGTLRPVFMTNMKITMLRQQEYYLTSSKNSPSPIVTDIY